MSSSAAEADMQRLIDHIREIGAVFIDPWVVVDAEGRVVDFNPHYRALFSRQAARKLQGSPFDRYVTLDLGEDGHDLPARCLASGKPLRYDEIPVQMDGEDTARSFIVSATPLTGDDGERLALILLRDVSDAATVQRKYKAMLDRETKEKERLRDEIGRKTKELMDTHMELNRTQKELMRFKKGLFG
jgi:PAS domain-containing protein